MCAGVGGCRRVALIFGGVMGGASAVLITTPWKECAADAPGSDPTRHALARAGSVAVVFHSTFAICCELGGVTVAEGAGG